MEAFEPLLRFLFWVGIIYLTFRLSARYLVPWIVARFIRKTQERFFEQNPHLRNDQHKQRSEGEVSIHSENKKASSEQHKNDLGEFVDFEEITETKEPS